MRGILMMAAGVLVMAPSLAHATSQPRETETGLVEKWPSAPITVVLDPSIEDLAPGATDEVRTAIATWLSGVEGLPKVVFENGTTRRGVAFDGVSVMTVGTMPVGHENDLAATTTYAADATGDILEADIVFNPKFTFAVMPAPSTSCSDVFDVGAVATHESGHFFGLGEDYADHATTMFVFTSACDAHKRELTPEDTGALKVLYAQPTAMTAHCDAAPPTKRGGLAGLMFAMLALAAARRFRR